MRWRPVSAVRVRRDGGLDEMVRTGEYGWFASGYRVPESGRIHWGRGAKVAAYVDCVRLQLRHPFSRRPQL